MEPGIDFLDPVNRALSPASVSIDHVPHDTLSSDNDDLSFLFPSFDHVSKPFAPTLPVSIGISPLSVLADAAAQDPQDARSPRSGTSETALISPHPSQDLQNNAALDEHSKLFEDDSTSELSFFDFPTGLPREWELEAPRQSQATQDAESQAPAPDSFNLLAQGLSQVPEPVFEFFNSYLSAIPQKHHESAISLLKLRGTNMRWLNELQVQLQKLDDENSLRHKASRLKVRCGWSVFEPWQSELDASLKLVGRHFNFSKLVLLQVRQSIDANDQKSFSSEQTISTMLIQVEDTIRNASRQLSQHERSYRLFFRDRKNPVQTWIEYVDESHQTDQDLQQYFGIDGYHVLLNNTRSMRLGSVESDQQVVQGASALMKARAEEEPNSSAADVEDMDLDGSSNNGTSESQHRKKFVCDVADCRFNRCFRSQCDLDRHKSSVHKELPSNKKIYVCQGSSCVVVGNDREWTRKDNFKTHCRNAHPDEDFQQLLSKSVRRPSKSDNPSKSDSGSKTNRNRPRQKSRRGEGLSLECRHKWCGRVGDRAFRRRDHYRDHLREVHREDIPKRRQIKSENADPVDDLTIATVTIERSPSMQSAGPEVGSPPVSFPSTPVNFDEAAEAVTDGGINPLLIERSPSAQSGDFHANRPSVRFPGVAVVVNHLIHSEPYHTSKSADSATSVELSPAGELRQIGSRPATPTFELRPSPPPSPPPLLTKFNRTMTDVLNDTLFHPNAY